MANFFGHFFFPPWAVSKIVTYFIMNEYADGLFKYLERMHKFAMALRNAFHGPLILKLNKCRSCFLVVSAYIFAS